jgi:hypothetical protein
LKSAHSVAGSISEWRAGSLEISISPPKGAYISRIKRIAPETDNPANEQSGDNSRVARPKSQVRSILQMPSRSEVSGRASLPMAMLGEMIPLLLVEHFSPRVFLALCVGSVDCDRAAFAVGRDNDMGRENNLPAFFGYYMERAVVNLFD